MSKFGDKIRDRMYVAKLRKANRKATRKHFKKTEGKSGVEQSIDKVNKKVKKAKNTKLGKTVTKVCFCMCHYVLRALNWK